MEQLDDKKNVKKAQEQPKDSKKPEQTGDAQQNVEKKSSVCRAELLCKNYLIPRKAHISERSGSVLIFSLIIMGMVTLLTQRLLKNVSVGIAFGRTMIAREQAEMLALGGIRMAIAQLAPVCSQKKRETRNAKKERSK